MHSSEYVTGAHLTEQNESQFGPAIIVKEEEDDV